jgi:hypothetical protein
MKDEISKSELKSLLMSHEKRETKEQEAAESEKEERLEAKAGIHEKSAFWKGFGEKLAFFGPFKRKTPEEQRAEAFGVFKEETDRGVAEGHYPAWFVKEYQKLPKSEDMRNALDGANSAGDLRDLWASIPRHARESPAAYKKHVAGRKAGQ